MLKTERIDMALPAGGRLTDAFAREVDTEIKALITLNGRTILQQTLEVLRATERAGRIVVIGPEAALDEARRHGADEMLAEGTTGPENIFRGLECLRSRQENRPARVLIMTTDLPFLTPEAVTAFLDACPHDAEAAVPVVTRSAFETRFPASGSVFVPLRDGAVTLGCAFLVEPQAVLRNRPHIERAFAARKSEAAMAKLLGPRVIARYLLRRLTVGDIERRCRRILNCVGAAVPNAPPELAFDIDLPEEYAYARAHLAKREETLR